MGKPSKIPFGVTTRLKEYHLDESLVKRPELPMTNAYFILGFCHEHRTLEQYAGSV
jgi:hypothetical protein